MASASMIRIRPADWSKDLDVVRALFREYADGLGIDLAFQNFETELAGLPGKYERPTGRLLIAWSGTQALGTVALRAVDGETCEMKRLFVRPAARGEALGRRLAEHICEEARLTGYTRICLDTLPTMLPALALYRSLGFVPVAPYVFNPVPGALFLALDL